ncbi:MAG: hypothetical protein HYZ71_08155, partial [Deltaproteobacteria bacterium]|nr:hypothetical protein [Deltaproteobacteria bacterium]
MFKRKIFFHLAIIIPILAGSNDGSGSGLASSSPGIPGFSCTQNDLEYTSNDGGCKQCSTGLVFSSGYIEASGLKTATAYCSSLRDGGFSDWRVPTGTELADAGTQAVTYKYMPFVATGPEVSAGLYKFIASDKKIPKGLPTTFFPSGEFPASQLQFLTSSFGGEVRQFGNLDNRLYHWDEVSKERGWRYTASGNSRIMVDGRWLAQNTVCVRKASQCSTSSPSEDMAVTGHIEYISPTQLRLNGKYTFPKTANSLFVSTNPVLDPSQIKFIRATTFGQPKAEDEKEILIDLSKNPTLRNQDGTILTADNLNYREVVVRGDFVFNQARFVSISSVDAITPLKEVTDLYPPTAACAIESDRFGSVAEGCADKRPGGLIWKTDVIKPLSGGNRASCILQSLDSGDLDTSDCGGIDSRSLKTRAASRCQSGWRLPTAAEVQNIGGLNLGVAHLIRRYSSTGGAEPHGGAIYFVTSDPPGNDQFADIVVLKSGEVVRQNEERGANIDNLKTVDPNVELEVSCVKAKDINTIFALDMDEQNPCSITNAGKAYTSVSGDKMMPICRALHVEDGIHFYTGRIAEFAPLKLIDNYKKQLPSQVFIVDTEEHLAGFRVEGKPFFVYAEPGNDRTPILRLYNKNNGTHYYTANSGEKDFLLRLANSPWSFEGEEGYIAVNPVPASVPIYHLYNNSIGDHIFTTAVTERNSLLGDPGKKWVEHTMVGYGPQPGEGSSNIVSSPKIASAVAASPATAPPPRSGSINATNISPIGNLDSVSILGVVSGWAADPGVPGKVIPVHIYANDKFIQSVSADQLRTDANNAFGLSGGHGFSFQLSQSYAGQSIKVYAIDNGGNRPNPLLTGSPKAFVNLPPIGNLDSLSPPGLLSGWAADVNAPSSSIMIHIYANNVFYQAVTANQLRSDANAQFALTGGHGFSVPLPSSLLGKSIQVYAIDSTGAGPNPPLTGSPKTYANLPPIGNFDGISSTGVISGWAADQNVPNTPILVHIYANDKFVRSIVADQLRTDANNAFGLSGGHGFSFVDSINSGVVSGWAYDPNLSAESIWVHLYGGGPAGIGTGPFVVRANVARPDVNSTRNVSGNHGFSFLLPLQFQRGQKVYAYGIDLNGGTNPLIDGSGLFFFENLNLQVGNDGDLMNIMRRNTGSGRVEVHTLSRVSNYQQYNMHVATPRGAGESDKFDFLSGGGPLNGDLVEIMRRNTGSGKVEVHILSRGSNYQTYTTHAATPITLADAENYSFLMVGRDLVAVRRRGGGLLQSKGQMELFMLAASSNYSQYIIATPLPWATGEEWKFDFVVRDRDIVAVLKAMSGSAKIEAHSLTAGSNYQNFGLHIATAIGINDGPKYEFGMTGSDLVGILRLGTGSGKIEIHTLT